MPRTSSPSEHHHYHQSHRPAPYHNHHSSSPTSSHLQPPSTHHRFSPSPTLVSRSYTSSAASDSSPTSSQRPLSPLSRASSIAAIAKANNQERPFNNPGELFPYQKGKKVSNDQLVHLLAHFKEDENPSKDQRLALANKLRMSFKALSIWFQNERANVKKGRSRAIPLQPPPLAPTKYHPPTFISSRRPLPVPPRTYPVQQQHSSNSPKYSMEFDEDDNEIQEIEMDDGEESDSSLDLESPSAEMFALPEVRIQLAEPLPEKEKDRQGALDQEGLLVAGILMDMKNGA